MISDHPFGHLQFSERGSKVCIPEQDAQIETMELMPYSLETLCYVTRLVKSQASRSFVSRRRFTTPMPVTSSRSCTNKQAATQTASNRREHEMNDSELTQRGDARKCSRRMQRWAGRNVILTLQLIKITTCLRYFLVVLC